MTNDKLIQILIESERDLSDMKFRMDVMQETLFEARRELEGVHTDETPTKVDLLDDELDIAVDECPCSTGCSSCGTV